MHIIILDILQVRLHVYLGIVGDHLGDYEYSNPHPLGTWVVIEDLWRMLTWVEWDLSRSVSEWRNINFLFFFYFLFLYGWQWTYWFITIRYYILRHIITNQILYSIWYTAGFTKAYKSIQIFTQRRVGTIWRIWKLFLDQNFT